MNSSATHPTIQILIVDDQALVRGGLKALLASEGDIEIRGEAGNAEAAVRMAERLHPDVVLMDLVMPGIGGVDAIRRIVANDARSRILVLTGFGSDDHVLAAIKSGALGYLLKDSEPRELIRAIRQVHKGEPWLDPVIARKVFDHLRRPSLDVHTLATAALTSRERDVLRLVARGMSNHEITGDLVLGETTVRTHVSNIQEKLQLTSRTQAALYALREGYASLPDAVRPASARLLEVLV